MIPTIESLFASFFSNPFVRGIFVLIAIDVATGIGAAFRIGYFDKQKVATFYRTNIMPYVPGYFVLWLFTAFGFSDAVPNEIVVVINGTGAAFIYTALVGSIWDNIKRTRAPLTPTDTSAMVHVENAESVVVNAPTTDSASDAGRAAYNPDQPH